MVLACTRVFLPYCLNWGQHLLLKAKIPFFSSRRLDTSWKWSAMHKRRNLYQRLSCTCNKSQTLRPMLPITIPRGHWWSLKAWERYSCTILSSCWRLQVRKLWLLWAKEPKWRKFGTTKQDLFWLNVVAPILTTGSSRTSWRKFTQAPKMKKLEQFWPKLFSSME